MHLLRSLNEDVRGRKSVGPGDIVANGGGWFCGPPGAVSASGQDLPAHLPSHAPQPQRKPPATNSRDWPTPTLSSSLPLPRTRSQARAPSAQRALELAGPAA
jgi:hypothetical protein